MAISSGNLQVIVPNLHRRYSGVTATKRMVEARLAKLMRAAWFGSDAADGIATLPALTTWGGVAAATAKEA